jgi:fumarylacetoacetase
VTLAYGVRTDGGVCAVLGDTLVDLSGLDPVFDAPSLNAFMAAGPEVWRQARERVAEGVELPAAGEPAEALLGMPFEVADYVDFYSSLHHATNLGRMFRPDADPLLPNWRHLPVGYHGRAGTVVPSGTPVRRPSGQSPGGEFGPSARLDIELELGFVIGTPTTMGEPVPIERALDHVFGVVLVNDWSARDIQAWEYQPLGPFLGKSFATSISAWVTPFALLEDRLVPGPPQVPKPLEYLRTDGPHGLDVELEIELGGTVVSRTNARGLYWTMPQQFAHATINGASLRTGDLCATGTISGPKHGSEGSLIELTRNGTKPIRVGDGSTRAFLEDGDEVVLRGRAGDVELGEVRGRILSARC